MTYRALLFDDDDLNNATSFIFMIRTPDGTWYADLTMLEYWRTTKDTETINIYRITPTDSFVSINRLGAPMECDLFPLSELPQIRSLVFPPWIPAKIIYTTIPIDQIVEFDAWSRDPMTPPSHPTWSHVIRPLLVDVPLLPPWEAYPVMEPQPTVEPQPTAPPATNKLPPHVAATMIAAATAAHATCPITLDTIDATDATVTPCGHVFTATALRRWLESRRHCPECRHPLTT